MVMMELISRASQSDESFQGAVPSKKKAPAKGKGKASKPLVSFPLRTQMKDSVADDSSMKYRMIKKKKKRKRKKFYLRKSPALPLQRHQPRERLPKRQKLRLRNLPREARPLRMVRRNPS